MKKVFMGYTSYQDVVYQVAKHSILKRTRDVEVYPIVQQSLRELGIYTRERSATESTEFSITRFLTPYLAGYSGWVLFVDNDVVALDPLDDLFALTDDRYAVMCVKHDYSPTSKMKLDGQKQTLYPRKNWSSLILWNCGHPKNRVLTPELINYIHPLYLHRFLWLEEEDLGAIDKEWNWLVGWDEESGKRPRLLHYTEGGPYFKEYFDCDYADVWRQEYESLTGRPFTQKDIIC